MEQPVQETVRERNNTIIKYNIGGVIMNLILAAAKLVCGIAGHSHALMLDSVNGLSDMFASVLSIISSLLGNKRASKMHPLGFGRMEYVFSLVITMIVMYIGVRSIVDSVDAIIHPHEAPGYGTFSIVLICVSLVMKLVYGIIMQKKGRKIHSVAMRMAGVESMGDSLISVAILISIGVYRILRIDIEHYLCIGISLLILYNGVGMIWECMTKLLGSRTNPELRKQIVQMFIKEDEVYNVSNLVIHNYGESILVGSADIEVDESLTAREITVLTKKLINQAEEVGVMMTSIGVQASNLNNPEAEKIWDQVLNLLREFPEVSRAHSPYVDLEMKKLSLALVLDYTNKNREKEQEQIRQKFKETFPDMDVEIHFMIDI